MNCKLIAVFVVIFSQGISSYILAQEISRSLEYDNLSRDYLLYVPSEIDSGAALSLIVNLHGLGSNAVEQSALTAMNRVAEREGFFVAYPQAINSNWLNGEDNIGFISAIVDDIAASYSVDPARIYATGLSQGGAMSYRLASQLSDQIAAAASVGGVPAQPLESHQLPVRPIPIMHIHGTSDAIAPYNGGHSQIGKEFPAVPTILSSLAATNQCDLNPMTKEIPNTTITDNSTVSRMSYSCATYLDAMGNSKPAELVHYRINQGGHNWPGSNEDWPDWAGSINQDINASELIWDFFENHSLPTAVSATRIPQFGQPANLGSPVNNGAIQISPNISNDGTRLHYVECQRGWPPRCRVMSSQRHQANSEWEATISQDIDDWTHMITGVTVSTDGLEMYFSDQFVPDTFPTEFLPADSRGGDLWVARRQSTEQDWEMPENLGFDVNSDAIDTYPNLSPNGLELYFTSDRDGGSGGLDLWVARRASLTESFDAPENLGTTINSPNEDGAGEISDDGLKLFFASRRPGGLGDFDIWMSSRSSKIAPWSDPVNLEVVNTPLLDSFPNLSTNDQRLYYMSGVGDPSAGDGDIWSVSMTPTTDVCEISGNASCQILAGDADQDLDFDQLDLVRVQVAAKYLTGQSATWGEGDWNGAPGGSLGNPPAGDGLFNQFDVVAAQQAGTYLTGPYAAIQTGGQSGDGQTSVIYAATTGELSLDAPAGTELTSINIDSAGGIFTGQPAGNLGGSFDNDADNNIFKATFGGSFGSLSFGKVAQVGLAEEFLLNDLTVVGSLSGGETLGNVDLIYVPEPSAMGLLLIATLLVHFVRAWDAAR